MHIKENFQIHELYKFCVTYLHLLYISYNAFFFIVETISTFQNSLIPFVHGQKLFDFLMHIENGSLEI